MCLTDLLTKSLTYVTASKGDGSSGAQVSLTAQFHVRAYKSVSIREDYAEVMKRQDMVMASLSHEKISNMDTEKALRAHN
jgi:hypothetical protein